MRKSGVFLAKIFIPSVEGVWSKDFFADDQIIHIDKQPNSRPPLDSPSTKVMEEGNTSRNNLVSIEQRSLVNMLKNVIKS